VLKAGDTMTGNLTISKSGPYLFLNATSSQPGGIIANRNSSTRWTIDLPNGDAESEANVGSNFAINRYTDLGGFLGTPVTINRASGQIATAAPILPQTTWTAAQQVAARKSVYAAPLDAQSHNNILINAAMDVTQGVATQTGVNFPAGGSTIAYVMDQWLLYKNGAVGFNAYQWPGLIPGFANGLHIAPLVAANAGADAVYLAQRIEGWRIARAAWGTANAVPITFGFWATFPVAGPTFLVRLVNAAYNAQADVYLTTTTANVPQFFTGTFPAQTSGTWPKDNAFGAELQIYLQYSGMHNCFAFTSDRTNITGVVLIPGSDIPSNSQLLMRPFDEELALCRRYFQKSFPYATTPANGATRQGGMVGIGVTTTLVQSPLIFFKGGDMRVTPTMTLYNATGVGTPGAGQWSYYNAGWIGGFGIAVGQIDSTAFNVNFGTATITPNGAYFVDGNWVASARM